MFIYRAVQFNVIYPRSSKIQGIKNNYKQIKKKTTTTTNWNNIILKSYKD